MLRDFSIPLMNEHLYDAGLRTLSEIFDGDEPHAPGGAYLRLGALERSLDLV